MKNHFVLTLCFAFVSSPMHGSAAAAKPKAKRTAREIVLAATLKPIATGDIAYMIKKAQDDAIAARETKQDDNETLARITMYEATAQALHALQDARAANELLRKQLADLKGKVKK